MNHKKLNSVIIVLLGICFTTVPLLGDDSRPSNVSGNLALHVLVAPDFDGLCGQEPGDTAGENVIVTETRVRIPLGFGTLSDL